MNRLARLFYVAVLVTFAVLTAVAVWLGLWWYAGLSVAFGLLFTVTGWYVLAQAWRPPPPRRRRPVRRKPR